MQLVSRLIKWFKSFKPKKPSKCSIEGHILATEPLSGNTSITFCTRPKCDYSNVGKRYEVSNEA